MTARTKYLAVLLASLALVASGCGDKGTTDTKDTTAKASPSADSGACQYVDSGQQPAKKVQKPPSTPVADGPVEVTIKTNFGDMPATLDAKNAPCAVNSFLSLSKQGYYDKTDCHRITSDKRGFHVLQCGDPTGSGSGDPGYRYAEELTGTETTRSAASRSPTPASRAARARSSSSTTTTTSPAAELHAVRPADPGRAQGRAEGGEGRDSRASPTGTTVRRRPR